MKGSQENWQQTVDEMGSCFGPIFNPAWVIFMKSTVLHLPEHSFGPKNSIRQFC
jgi:hypothetical protein